VIVIHVILAKIGGAGPRTPIFGMSMTSILVIHVISAKIGAAGLRTPIFVT
jgi:hypothetical protein